MDKAFDMVGSVSPGNVFWRFKVRVLRLWNVESFTELNEVNSIEMVLIDEKGDKIHASIPRELLYLFCSKIIEGEVYKLFYFSVSKESGLYRTTPHPYKLNFEMKTKVQRCENSSIDHFGLSFTTVGEICDHGPRHDFLVDVVGLITGISAPREYIYHGKITKMIVFEITDNSGKCDCILSGHYVDDFEKILSSLDDGLPFVVVQFAKIRFFRGNVAIQSLLSTRFYVNPLIPENLFFKGGLSLKGIDMSSRIPSIGPPAMASYEDDFLVNYPRTIIANLLERDEDGIYIVCATVDGLVEFSQWWYPGCSCDRIVSASSGAFYCKQCVKLPFKMVPRFRVELRVGDGSGQAIFVVFDNDITMLLGKRCHDLVSLAKDKDAGYCPFELDMLKGLELLFKVEKRCGGGIYFNGSFRVMRICTDISIMGSFESALGEGDSFSNYDATVEEEFVECGRDIDFLNDLVVSPSFDGSGEEFVVSTQSLMSEAINLNQNSAAGVSVVVPGCVELNCDKVLSSKRDLSAAFFEGDDVAASMSKINKRSQD
ncbi:replication factor-A carboxy-terminal domain protein [Trifolium pratense]|uniref:Uncharacterized protein n=2 Tax=Trifolium pratense TaxID=57577 RepID=A0ACB0JK47_TRIPR|nr:replication factor-A carboxy-terminal domain protein [Trifolium pratense]CAJ2644632.1 unnamed protein product [Trifolium pratense]